MGELQQFVQFFANFHDFHGIAYMFYNYLLPINPR